MTLRKLNIAALIGGFSLFMWVALQWVFHTPTVAVQSLWVTMGFIGSLITIWNLREAVRDRRAVVEAGSNGERRFLADDFVRVEVIRLVQTSSVLVSGLYILQSAPVLTTEQRKLLHIPEWTVASVMITISLLLLVGGTVAQAALSRRQRTRLQTVISSDAEADVQAHGKPQRRTR